MSLSPGGSVGPNLVEAWQRFRPYVRLSEWLCALLAGLFSNGRKQNRHLSDR